MESPPITTVLLDLDGVLVDLARGILELYHVPDPDTWLPELTSFDGLARLVSKANPHGMSVTQEGLWATVGHRGADFWAGLRPTPWAQQILDTCTSRAEVAICSKPLDRDPGSAAGKLVWCEQYLPKSVHRVLTAEKWLLAKPTTLLVDDCPGHIGSFVREGGQGFAWPTWWNGGGGEPHHAEQALERLAARLGARP